MTRPQFSLKTMLWLTVVVAAFFGGGEWAKWRWAAERAKLLADLSEWKEFSAETDDQNLRLHSKITELERRGLSPTTPNSSPH